MANRVILGARNSEFGMWISKPGVNVLTAGESGLMWTAERAGFQFCLWGSFQFGSATTINITIPNQGFYPVSLMWPLADVGSNVYTLTYTSMTNLRITRSTSGNDTVRRYYYITSYPQA